ncbi:MAG: hypothetical protein C0596_06175 [Marinilabiliales bacterium]|nr:MAG: hypothetical protein C0596_06175 [Marinilabiliales bacterium]
MEIFCLEDFKIQFEKLISKKNYSILEQEIRDYFFDKSVEDLCSGRRLNNSDITPYIKKRLCGRGGFRMYFLLIIKEERLYLMFVHPKTGSMGYENIDDESKAMLYKKVLSCIITKDLYKVEVNEERTGLVFTKVEN